MTYTFRIENQQATNSKDEELHRSDEDEEDVLGEFFENFEVDSNTGNCLPYHGHSVVIVDGEPLEEKLGLNLEQPKNNNKRTIRAVQPTIALPKVVKAPKESNEKQVERRKREAEAKKRRRQSETPEQRQHRLALHAERMRKTRQANKQHGQAQQQSQQQQPYVGSYEVAHPSAHSQTAEYATTTPVQIVAAMPQHQANYHQQAPHYRQSHQQPTIITVPIPASTAGNGPLTIHVTLPEHLQNNQGMPQQLHLVPAQPQRGNSGANGGQFVVTQDQYGNQQQMHVIQIQTQPSPANHTTGPNQPQHIIIQQPTQSQQHANTPQAPRQIASSSAASVSNDRPVPQRFKNLTDEQIARRRKANAERSRRRRAMETQDQRAERNRRTAERMRQRRAKIAEERGIVKQEPRTSTLSAARFEEIFQSVVNKNMEEMNKDDPKDLNHLAGNQMNNQQHIIVSGPPHQIPHQQQVVLAQPTQGTVYHQQRDSSGYAIYQPAQSQAQQPQRIQIVQSSAQQMNRI